MPLPLTLTVSDALRTGVGPTIFMGWRIVVPLPGMVRCYWRPARRPPPWRAGRFHPCNAGSAAGWAALVALCNLSHVTKYYVGRPASPWSREAGLSILGGRMSDPAEQQAAIADFLTEMLLLGLHPEPVSPQPPLPDDAKQALERLAEVMGVMYGDQRG